MAPPRRTPLHFILLALLVLGALAWRLPTPAPAASPTDIAVLFPGSLTGSATTNPGPADALFSSLAGNATTSIDVALYDFDRTSVRDALIAAKQRGLSVRVVGDNEAAADPSYQPFYASLSNAGIPVVNDTKSSLMHNKFAVFDAAVTWTGSANFSDTSFTRNGENIVVITDTVVASIYHTEFEELFSGEFSNDKTDNTAHNTTVGGSAVEIAFTPTDGVEERIIAAIASADVRVQVAQFTFTNQDIAAALIAAHQRGVAVEVLLDQVAAGSQYSQRDPLCAAGITVRVEDFAAKIHDKYAVVDAGTASDPLALTGSTNWTKNAVEANDENLLIIHDATLASAFASDIDRLRAAIEPDAFACNVGAAPTATATTVVINDPMCALLPDRCAYLPIVLRNVPAEIPTFTPITSTTRVTPTGTPTATPTHTPTPTTTTQPATEVAITFIEYDPPDTLSEYVQIVNSGSGAVDMTNWTLRDLANNTYTFPAFTLAGGATVRVWTNSGTNDGANLYWGRAQAVWNNTGDTAILRDAQGGEVNRYSYTP